MTKLSNCAAFLLICLCHLPIWGNHQDFLLLEEIIQGEESIRNDPIKTFLNQNFCQTKTLAKLSEYSLTREVHRLFDNDKKLCNTTQKRGCTIEKELNPSQNDMSANSVVVDFTFNDRGAPFPLPQPIEHADFTPITKNDKTILPEGAALKEIMKNSIIEEDLVCEAEISLITTQQQTDVRDFFIPIEAPTEPEIPYTIEEASTPENDNSIIAENPLPETTLPLGNHGPYLYSLKYDIPLVAESQHDKNNFSINTPELNELPTVDDFALESSEETLPEFEDPENTLWIAGLSAQLGLELGNTAFQVVLDPVKKTALFAEVTYPIQQINKKMGDRFKKDETLIQMNDSVAKGNYEKALAQLKQMTAKLEAAKHLYRDGLASYFELKEAETEKAKAQAELILAEKNLKATKISAPYSGLVENIFIEEYELPQNGKELIKIINDDILIAKMLIPSNFLKKLKIGTTVYLHISETKEVLEAKVTRLGGMIDPASSTMKIEAEINNKDKKYKAGMTGIGTLDPPSKTQLKLQAISNDN